MNIFNKFLNLKTWQKLGIGIALLTIFKYLSMSGFIINVKAESYTNPNIIMSDDITGAGYTGIIRENGRYKSNWLSQANLDTLYNFSNSSYGGMKVRDYYSYITDSDNLLKTSSYSSTDLTANLISNFETRQGQTGYYRGFGWYYNQSGQPNIYPLEKGHKYSFLFEFYTQDCEWSSSSFTEDAFNITGSYLLSNSTNTYYDLTEVATFDVTTYVPGMTYTNPNYGYVLVDIYLDPNLYPVFNSSYDMKLGSIYLRLRNTTYSVDDEVDMSTYNYLFKSSTGGNYRFTGIYLLDNVDVFVGDQDYTSSMEGTYLNQTLYQTCDSLDIACHVENIFRGVKSFTSNLIFNIKQLFNYLFIPDFQAIHDRVDDFHTVIDLKYPDIQALIDYKDDFFARASNISPQHTISFSGASLPGYNINIIPAFTFNFDTIINDSTFNPIYLVLRALFIVTISISYCLFVFRIFSKMFNKEG